LAGAAFFLAAAGFFAAVFFVFSAMLLLRAFSKRGIISV